LIKHIALATAAIVASGIKPAARGRRRALAPAPCALIQLMISGQMRAKASRRQATALAGTLTNSNALTPLESGVDRVKAYWECMVRRRSWTSTQLDHAKNHYWRMGDN
jgi:hypothetical protein